MEIVLVMFRSDGERRSFSLNKAQTIIGRREDCDLRIPLGEISRKHCKLSIEEDGLKVEDLGSSNGTFINGKRVQTAAVAPGDTVQMGSIAFVVQIDGVPADDQLQPQMAAPKPTGNEDTDTHAEGEQEPTRGGKKKAKPEEPASDEFDPMAILTNDESIIDASGMDLNLEESSHGESAAETP